MKLTFSAVDGTQDNAFSFDVDPAQFRGCRTAFGAQVQVFGNLEFDRTKVVPLQMGGILAWHAEGNMGLSIPMQSVGYGGTIALSAPISDAQLASIEDRRANGEANLALTLFALGRRPSEGASAYRMGWSPQPYVVPRDRWAEAMAACGLGRIHIVEVPVPPGDLSEHWLRSAKMLARSSAELAQGRYGESMGNVRNALQEMVDVLERWLGIQPKSPAFAARVNELGSRLATLHERRGADPYAVLAALVRAVFDFTSDPVHRGYDVPSRDDAAFALSAASALHIFLARRPLPTVAADQTASS